MSLSRQVYIVNTYVYIALIHSTFLDHLPRQISYFRCLFLLNQAHNRCYPVTMLPVRFLFYFEFLIISAFVLIRLFTQINTTERAIMTELFFAFIISSFLVLHISGKMFKDSESLKWKLFQRAASLAGWEGKIWRKTAKSLQSFGVRVGSIRCISYAALSAFYITTTSVLTTVLVTFTDH